MLLLRYSNILSKFFVLIGLLLSVYGVEAQQQEQYFNRFQYHRYNWRVFSTTDFRIYAPLGNDSLVSYIANEYPKAAKVLKHRMGTSILKAPSIIIYPSVDQSYESNIGLYEQEPYTFPTLLKKSNRIVLAFTGSREDLKAQLYESIARELWESQMKEEEEDGLTGGKPINKDKVPLWFKEGAIRFYAHGWTIESEDNFRNSYRQNNLRTWDASLAYQPRLSGQAFCYFLTEKYYPLAVMQLCNQLKTKSLQRAVRLITKKNLNELYIDCSNFYRSRFGLDNTLDSIRTTIAPANLGQDGFTFKKQKGSLNALVTGPDGKQIAYVVTNNGQRDVYVYNNVSKKSTRLTSYQLPPWINQHNKDIYPLLYWIDNIKVQVTIPEKGKLVNKVYTSSGGLFDKETIEAVSGIKQIIPTDRNTYLMSAWRNGQSDIVKYDIRKERYTTLTADKYDDGLFSSDASDKLIFSADRPEKEPQHKTDTISVKQGLFSITDKQIKPVITDTFEYVHWEDPVLLKDGRLLAINTLKGTKTYALFNNPKASNDFIDLGEYEPVQISGDKVSRYKRKGDSLYIKQESLEQWINESKVATTEVSLWLIDYRNREKERQKEDSILNASKDETPSFLEGILAPKDAKEQSKKREDSISRSLAYDPKKVKPYILQLHSAYFTAKVNNDYYINRYQPYLNYQGQFKFPEIGGMVQGGFTDLFENHHFNIAFRLPAGNEGSDFFVHYQNTAKKLNWGLTYFRKVESLNADSKRNWADENGDYYPNVAKVKTHYYEASLDYPLSYYLSFGLTTALRQDHTIFLATERYSLNFADIKSLWWISTPSITYNKLKPTVPFLYRGLKVKAGIDVFKAFTQQQEALLGSNIQFTHFQPLYKYITLETKLKAGYSTGQTRVLYNLGGTDNNVAPKVDSNVHFSQSATYAFHTLVTPFRGYLQNNLYGDQYALLNADVYFPLFQTLILIETPLQAINLLQLGIFTDVGTAKEAWNKIAVNKGILYSYGLSARTSLAGYPLRVEVAWPGTFSTTPIWYFSLTLK
jgi:hypothetical protein